MDMPEDLRHLLVEKGLTMVEAVTLKSIVASKLGIPVRVLRCYVIIALPWDMHDHDALAGLMGRLPMLFTLCTVIGQPENSLDCFTER